MLKRAAARRLFDDIAPNFVNVPPDCTLQQAEKIVRDEVGFDIAQGVFNILVQGVVELSRSLTRKRA